MRQITCLLISSLLAMFASTDALAAPNIKVGGTGSASAILEKLVEVYNRTNPESSVEVINPPLGSSAGIRAVINGFLGLAISGRPLSPEEEKKSRGQEFAKSPLAFVVNGNVGKNGLSRQELIDIYSGKMTKWGDGTPLRLVLRPLADTDTGMVRALSPEMDQALMSALGRPGMAMATHDIENSDLLVKSKGLFGAMTLCQLRAQGLTLNAMAIDGIAPSLQSMRSGTYPINKMFYVITQIDPIPAVKQFELFLFSEKARHVMTANNCFPVAN